MTGRRLEFIALLAEPRVAVPLLIGISVLLRLPNLEESFWFDEVLYSTSFAAKAPLQVLKSSFFGFHAPAYPLLLLLWTRLFGENEIIARLPSLTCGVVSILLTYTIARSYGSSGMALLAALLLCFSPVHVWYSQEATPYMMTMCFLLAAIAAWHRLKAGMNGWLWYLLYFVLLGCTVFSHYFSAVFLLPLTFFALDAGPRPRTRIIVINLLTGALIVVVLAAKSLWGSLFAGQSFLRPFTLFEGWMLFFNWFLHGNTIWTINPYEATPSYLLNQPLLLLCQIVFFVIVLRGIVVNLRTERRVQTLELLSFLLVLPVAMFLVAVLGFRQTYTERYVIVSLPFFAIALAREAVGFSSAWLRRACVFLILAIAITSYVLLLYKSDTWIVYKHNPDMRSAANYLAAQPSSADEAIVIFPTGQADLAYYVNKLSPPGHPRVEDYLPAKLEQGFSSGKLREVHLVKNNYWEGGFPDVYLALESDPRLVMTELRTFKGVQIFTFTPR